MPIDKSRIKYFSVKWTALVSLIDGLDLDDLPDTDFITGVISFKPLSGGPLKFRSNTAGTEPFTLFPMTRRINISSGEFNEQSRKYIKLEAATNEHIPNAWNWQVIFDLAYNGTPIPLSPTSFMGAPDQVIDLTDYLPVKDLISGIEYARGPQGFSVFDITLSGAKNDILTFVSDAPGTPVIRQLTIPSMSNAYDSAGIAVAASDIARDARDTAVSSKDTAVLSAADALASKNAAKTSETNSKTSETNANASKVAAGTSETNALASKNAAATSATNAATSETNALGSKNAAATSATNAGTSATNAGNSATAAQTARTGAETARTGAEQARDAATSMVVPDAAVTRPKLKTSDHTNLLFGAGLENGLEATDWPTNTYGANLAIDTTTVWDGTRSLKITGNGTLQSVEIPTSTGEVFQFSAMTYVPVVVVGSGGLRMQWMDGAGTWADISTAAVNAESSGIAAATWTRANLIGVMPAGARRVRVRLAHANSNYGSGIFFDDMDWRRIQDTYAPQSILGTHIGTGQVAGTQLANGAVTAGKIVNGGVDAYSRLAQSVSEQIAAQSYLMHDMLAFLSNITMTTETTTDGGTTWSAATAITAPFNNREGEFTSIGTAAVGQGVRFTFIGSTTPISNVTAKYLEMSFGYTATAPNRTITADSSPDGTTWTGRLNATGQTANAQSLLLPITDWGAHTRVRVTILNTTASGLQLGALRLIVARPGGEGRGNETGYPFSWDFAKQITFPGNLRFTTGSPGVDKVWRSDASGWGSWTQVLTAMIGDLQVTLGKLAADSVDSSKIVDLSILTGDIGNLQITLAKMAANSVDSSKIVDDSIVNADINSAAAIALSKLAAGYMQGLRNGTPTTTKVEVMTEAQFTALATKDANTIYLRSA